MLHGYSAGSNTVRIGEINTTDLGSKSDAEESHQGDKQPAESKEETDTARI